MTENTIYAPSYVAQFNFSGKYCIIRSSDKCMLPDTSTAQDATVNNGAASLSEALNIRIPPTVIRINTAGPIPRLTRGGWLRISFTSKCDTPWIKNPATLISVKISRNES